MGPPRGAVQVHQREPWPAIPACTGSDASRVDNCAAARTVIVFPESVERCEKSSLNGRLDVERSAAARLSRPPVAVLPAKEGFGSTERRRRLIDSRYDSLGNFA